MTVIFSREVDIALRAVFAAVISVNLAGNILVCLVVRRFKYMQTPMNYLLVHLAVCDMLVGFFIFPRHVLFGLYQHPSGLTGDLLCKFFTYGNVSWWMMSVSVFLLVVIAWERYNAIMNPFQSRFSKRYLKFAIILSWVLSVIVGIPATVGLVYNARIKSCDYLWRADWISIVDSAIWLSIVCCLPFAALFVLYGHIIWKVWLNHQGVADVSQRSLQLSRKQITKTALTVTIIFFLCFMPNSLYYCIVTFAPQYSYIESLQTTSPIFYPVSHMLLLLNSSVNPVIYALQSTRFRSCMKCILCGGLQPGHRVRNSHELQHMTPMSRR